MSKIIHLGGQSQMAGPRDIATELEAEYKTVFDDIKIWNGGTFASLDYSVNNNQYPTKNGQYGAQFALLKDLQIGWGETIYVIHTAESAKAMNNYWKIGQSGHNSIQRYTYEAYIYLWNTLKVRDAWEFYDIWIQGEGDSGTEAPSLAYEADYALFIPDVQIRMRAGTSFTNSKRVWVNAMVNSNIVNEGYPYVANVKTAQINVAATSSNYHTFDTDAYELHNAVDDPHFSKTGMRLMAKDLAAYIIDNEI